MMSGDIMSCSLYDMIFKLVYDVKRYSGSSGAKSLSGFVHWHGKRGVLDRFVTDILEMRILETLTTQKRPNAIIYKQEGP